jgi:hypothetical protein
VVIIELKKRKKAILAKILKKRLLAKYKLYGLVRLPDRDQKDKVYYTIKA